MISKFSKTRACSPSLIFKFFCSPSFPLVLPVPLVPLNPSRGFSFLELLIVIAIMSLLASAGMGFYRGFVKDVEIKSATKMIESDLRQMRSKSMIGEDGYKWGVRFVKSASGDYYITFSTDGTNSTTTATTTLSAGITFSDPSTGYKEVIFNKISGTIPTATTTSITVENTTATTTISTIGTIY